MKLESILAAFTIVGAVFGGFVLVAICIFNGI